MVVKGCGRSRTADGEHLKIDSGKISAKYGLRVYKDMSSAKPHAMSMEKKKT